MTGHHYTSGRLMYDALLRGEFPAPGQRQRTGKPLPKVSAFTPTDRYVRVGNKGVHHFAVTAVTVEAAGRPAWTGFRFLCGGHTTNPRSALPEIERICDDCVLADEPAVYVYTDALGQPLYVGSSHQALQRMRQHGWTARWWPSATDATVTFLSDLPTARAVELDTIQSLQPIHNIRGKAVA